MYFLNKINLSMLCFSVVVVVVDGSGSGSGGHN